MGENKLSKEEAIIEFLKLPQEYDYMIISPIQARRQLRSKFLRDKIFELKGSKCERCGSNKNITLHHKTYELLIPKVFRRLAIGSGADRIEQCNNHSRKIIYYANQDHLWQLIEQRFPSLFEQTLKNMEVLCWGCHKRRHRDYEKETGSFIPLHSNHKEKNIDLYLSEEITKKISNYPTWMAKIKEQYPNAYEPWTFELDQSLIKKYKEGNSVSELCKIFQRQPGGINSRLKKLGLIQ